MGQAALLPSPAVEPRSRCAVAGREGVLVTCPRDVHAVLTIAVAVLRLAFECAFQCMRQAIGQM
ncbi:hypothetical protein, partial [Salmonella enterica]|uniref:hypothetical protein n=1 Tax=Salmonella enterica TaxID=28901 RepID=UPI0021B17EBF